jgi:DNA-directed RNA polymerase specialized sigma24 family protein
VPTAEEWRTVVAQIRSGTPNAALADDAPSAAGAKPVDVLQSSHLPRLYELALADGPLLLRGFRRRLGDERILDLVHDLLAAKLEAIVLAEEPRALFCTALQRRAISWLRRGDSAVVAEAEGAGADERADERQEFLLDARNALERLPERERAMVVAVALGEEREAIAQEFRTTRANVDQIISRVRRRFAEGNR